MQTIEVYTAKELKEKNPSAFDKAFEKWRDSQDEIFWSDEIMGSLKAVFENAGIRLNNWSIGPYSQSWVRFSMDEEGEFTGRKAINRIRENLLDNATFKRVKIKLENGRESFRYDLFKKNGDAWSCEFTGVCFDHDFVDSLLDDIRGGCSLSDAFHNLADVAGRLFESQWENQTSEESFLEDTDAYYTLEGTRV